MIAASLFAGSGNEICELPDQAMSELARVEACEPHVPTSRSLSLTFLCAFFGLVILAEGSVCVWAAPFSGAMLGLLLVLTPAALQGKGGCQ